MSCDETGRSKNARADGDAEADADGRERTESALEGHASYLDPGPLGGSLASGPAPGTGGELPVHGTGRPERRIR